MTRTRKPNEPTFTFRASDPHAVEALTIWCNFAATTGVAPDRVAEVRDVARQMQAWRDGQVAP